MTDKPTTERGITELEVVAAIAFLKALGDRPYADFGRGAGCGLLLRCIQSAIIAADAYRTGKSE